MRHVDVEAPAFTRGKERFSAPGKIRIPIVRFSAGTANFRAKSPFKIADGIHDNWRILRNAIE